MNSSISGHHVEVSPAMREHAVKRIMSLQRRCPEEIVSVDVTFTVEKRAGKGPDCQKACAKINLAGKELHVSGEGENAYVAVDNLRNKAARQIDTYSKKLHDHHREVCPKREHHPN